MSDANPHRGEIEIDFGAGGKYVLRPDFEAVAAIDEQLGGILPLAMRLARDPANLRLDEMAVIVAEGMKGAARKDGRLAAANVEKVKRLIFDAGISKAHAPCAAIIASALNGGATETGEAGNE